MEILTCIHEKNTTSSNCVVEMLLIDLYITNNQFSLPKATFRNIYEYNTNLLAFLEI